MKKGPIPHILGYIVGVLDVFRRTTRRIFRWPCFTFPMYHLSSVFSTLKTGCANSYGALPFQSGDSSWYRSLDDDMRGVG